jgi:aminodeoxyfutalosine synthase
MMRTYDTTSTQATAEPVVASLSDLPLRDPALAPVADKVLEGRRLTLEDGMVLFRTPDLPGLMRLADLVRRRKVGHKAYYVHSLRLSQTNICYVGCTFCGFQRRFGEDGVWDYDLPQVWEYVDQYWHPDLTEIHNSSGHHPKHEWQYYLDLVRGLTERYPGAQVKAWTAAEIHHFTKITRPRLGYREVLEQLKEAGLVAMPGGGAEIFAERVRKQIALAKVTADDWLLVHRTAHELGLPTNATMLYGHIETLEERLDHMLRLRAQQDETGGFLSFIPLAFQPDNNQLAKELGTRHTTGVDDLRTYAVGRLMLDNIPHLKAYWIMIGVKTAQIALSFGADDIDGTVTEEKIAHDAGAPTAQSMTVHELVRLIREAGRKPVERDTVFNTVKEW